MGKNVIERIEEASGPLFSFEVIPPLKGVGIETLFKAIDPLIDLKPSFINVTYHREEFVYKKREKGYLEKVSMRKRPGTVSICAAIQHRYSIDTVPHLICGGFTKEETENALIDLDFLGINNVLALRGDPIKTETHFSPTDRGHAHAVDLVRQITDMNRGVYLDDEIREPAPTNFCVGVAGYPERHFESPHMDLDFQYLKEKIDSGAQYIVTQLFFDNQKFFAFRDRCWAEGIRVPIIPGIKPIEKISHLTFMPKFFHVEIPGPLTHSLMKCKTDDEARQVGIDWGMAQCKELIGSDVPGIHFFTMGKSKSVRAIAESVFSAQ